MIKFKSNRGETELKAHGDVFELMSDTFVMIRSVYDALIENGNKASAEIFKGAVTSKIGVAFLNDEELCNIVVKSKLRDAMLRAKMDGKNVEDLSIAEIEELIESMSKED